MLFVKAAKVVALSITFIPITGCAIGTGIVYASLLKSVAYAPDSDEVLFGYASLGFALIETFSFFLFAMVGIIYTF
jgi:F0F1-type ATP synthase membrane subunit c/vacuolar-type H+-ATPase subunit K